MKKISGLIIGALIAAMLSLIALPSSADAAVSSCVLKRKGTSHTITPGSHRVQLYTNIIALQCHGGGKVWVRGPVKYSNGYIVDGGERRGCGLKDAFDGVRFNNRYYDDAAHVYDPSPVFVPCSTSGRAHITTYVEKPNQVRFVRCQWSLPHSKTQVRVLIGLGNFDAYTSMHYDFWWFTGPVQDSNC